MKPTKTLEYLQEIKKNHKVLTQFSGDYSPISLDWPFVRAMMNATRLNGTFLFRPYTTALHCYYTGILFQTIALKEQILVTPANVDFVFKHDVFEVVTGDVLLPVKIHSKETKRKWDEIESEILETYPELRHLSDEYAELNFGEMAFRLFKACDLLELFIFCIEEQKLGNLQVGIVIVNCRKLLPEFKIGSITRYVDSV